jgi:hypothetical protein
MNDDLKKAKKIEDDDTEGNKTNHVEADRNKVEADDTEGNKQNKVETDRYYGKR